MTKSPFQPLPQRDLKLLQDVGSANIHTDSQVVINYPASCVGAFITPTSTSSNLVEDTGHYVLCVDQKQWRMDAIGDCVYCGSIMDGI